MKSLRETIVQLMVEIHLVSLDYALERVSEMDEIELHRRFRMYTGTEFPGTDLSASKRLSRAETDFYQVFGSATATARCAALKSAPELPTEPESGGVGP